MKIPFSFTPFVLPTLSGTDQNEGSFYMYKFSKFNMLHINKMSYVSSKSHNLSCSMIKVKT